MTNAMVPLEVELQHDMPEVIRRSFLVPLDISFFTLHHVLLIGFGLHEGFPHRFTTTKGKVCIDEDLSLMVGPHHIPLDKKRALYMYHGAKLSDYYSPNLRLEYSYDMDEGYNLFIKVGRERIVAGEPYVECTGGEGFLPPKSGGEYSYEKLCVLARAPEHQPYMRLLDCSSDDETFFDQDCINERMKKVFHSSDMHS